MRLLQKLRRWIFSREVETDSHRLLPTDKAALLDFIQNVYWGEELSVEEAKWNTMVGLLELVDSNGHRSNGVLVTTNGFFVTAHHCVQNEPETRMVRDFAGNLYSLERVCCISRRRDLALAKADFPSPAGPMRYRISCEQKFKWRSDPAVALTRRNGEVVVRGGYIRGKIGWMLATDHDGKNRWLRNDQIYLDMEVQPGDSGGAVVAADGRLTGILTSRYNDSEDGMTWACAARWFDVLRLISAYCAKK